MMMTFRVVYQVIKGKECNMFFELLTFKWPELSFDELKKRTRILIIDDENFEYISLFKGDGYAIDKWDDIKTEKLTDLERGLYDIILLDIQGVGKELSQDQGFGILRHLKHSNPTQIIIAYSNSDYNLKYQDFFKLANDTIGKASDYFEFKEIVDKNIQMRFSYNYYYSLVEKEINNKADMKRVKRYFNKSLKGKDINIFSHYLNDANLSKDIISIIIQIISSALQIYLTLKGSK
jgi:CheY-like chemotaxis protein